MLNYLEKHGVVGYDRKRGGDPITIIGYRCESAARILVSRRCLWPLPADSSLRLLRSMMVRGESFRSDLRVPTHMLNHMSNGQSLDRVVQSAGRASFIVPIKAGESPRPVQVWGLHARSGLRTASAAGPLLSHQAQVLMSSLDLEAVRAYIRYMNLMSDRIAETRTISSCFDREPPHQYNILLLFQHSLRCFLRTSDAS